MKQHLNIWKKILLLYFAEVLILPLLAVSLGILGEQGRLLFTRVVFGFTGIWYGDAFGILGLTPFILNSILGLLVLKDLDIKWRIFYTVFLGLIIWPLALFTVLLTGKQFGLLHSY